MLSLDQARRAFPFRVKDRKGSCAISQMRRVVWLAYNSKLTTPYLDALASSWFTEQQQQTE